MHIVSSLLIPEGRLPLTPEKFLLALNCTNFISMIHSVDLTHFINDTDTEFNFQLSCIEFIHSHDLVHRDIKPANFVMATGHGSHLVNVIDFGLAKKFRDHDGAHFPLRVYQHPSWNR